MSRDLNYTFHKILLYLNRIFIYKRVDSFEIGFLSRNNVYFLSSFCEKDKFN